MNSLQSPIGGMFHNQSHRQFILLHTWTRSGGKNSSTYYQSLVFVLYIKTLMVFDTTYYISNLTLRFFTLSFNNVFHFNISMILQGLELFIQY